MTYEAVCASKIFVLDVYRDIKTGDDENNDNHPCVAAKLCPSSWAEKYNFGYRDSETGDDENNDDHPCVTAKLCPCSWLEKYILDVTEKADDDDETFLPHPCVAPKLCPSSWANVKKVAQASSRQADTVVP